MKATLSFDLNEPDEASAHQLCLDAPHLAYILNEFQEWLRRKAKYEDVDMISLELVRAELNSLIIEREVSKHLL